MKTLLQSQSTRILPIVQRIVWLYKRWQPLYSIIQRTVLPKVEFVQGIPTDLDDDEFFNPRINNLLVLDDLFAETGKDKRITDLFTEGSHHRSLSVISINQNLFGNKDPTQRRNCHYLVIFNNPVDRQSVMTLARQMYPRNIDKFMKLFVKATKYPYGYLLVDLKPFTHEDNRLKCLMPGHQIHKKEHVTQQNAIKGDMTQEMNHSSFGGQSVHINSSPEQENMDKGHSCDDCGLVFDSAHDVQRHVKRGWCPEYGDDKKRKHEEINDSDHDDSVEDNEAYIQLWERAIVSNNGKYDTMYNKLIEDGEESDDAHEMADDRIQPYNEKEFFRKYTTLIDNYILPLRNNGLHNKIMTQINILLSKGIDTSTATTKVLRKQK